MYPEVFDKEDVDGGNATKILKSDPMWEMALGINKDNENTFAEIRFFSIFHKEDVIPYVQGKQVEADCIYLPNERASGELIATSVNMNHPEKPAGP